MTDPRGITPLTAFVDSLDSASHAEFAARADSRVAHEDAFDAMREHILGLYEGVSATHSFADEQGAVFDCIPIEQQPALRGSDESVTDPPDLPPLPPGDGDDDERTARLADLVLGPERTDPFGNTMNCPEGSIPMRRVALEDMTRFATVRDFMRKSPHGSARPPREDEPATVPVTHRWAHAYQNVANGGGHSYLGLWSPPIGANQVFSLSQHWYVGGSGANLQTAECGWQVYPALYGDSRPHLFTYWTADDYASTGCYNLTCSAFVQIGTTFAPGMALGPVSVGGGQQYEIELAYWLANGRWYLYFNGTQGSNCIGYYPASLYGAGALATQAAEIDYGGETTGTTSFPPMGSGAFADQGWQRAAYQRAIGYWPPPGGALINANLAASQAWPGCYTAQLQLYAAPWSETLWYGGPGGTC